MIGGDDGPTSIWISTKAEDLPPKEDMVEMFREFFQTDPETAKAFFEAARDARQGVAAGPEAAPEPESHAESAEPAAAPEPESHAESTEPAAAPEPEKPHAESVEAESHAESAEPAAAPEPAAEEPRVESPEMAAGAAVDDLA